MFAILETGGKQVKAVAGRHIDIEKIPQNKGEKISLSNVLMLVNGKDSKVGNPFINGALVKGEVIEQAKDDKVIVYKMRPKKGTRKKQGHRQLYSRVFIESIELNGDVIAKSEIVSGKKQKSRKKEELNTEAEDITENTEKTTKQRNKPSKTKEQ